MLSENFALAEKQASAKRKNNAKKRSEQAKQLGGYGSGTEVATTSSTSEQAKSESVGVCVCVWSKQRHLNSNPERKEEARNQKVRFSVLQKRVLPVSVLRFGARISKLALFM